MMPKVYINMLIDTHVRIFGSKTKQLVMSPLEKGDHPELDMSKELGEDGIRDYQSFIGALPWSISLGRMDIATAVMTLSGFPVKATWIMPNA